MSQILNELEQIIALREQQKEAGSYTCRLLLEGTLVERKVNEEAYELIEAAFKGQRSRMIEEGADLLFHFLVLLRKHSINFQEIENELIKRRKQQ